MNANLVIWRLLISSQPRPSRILAVGLESQATDDLLEQLMVSASDYLIYVAEDYTSADRQAVHRLEQSLRSKSHGFRELLVVHNLRQVTDLSALHQAWKARVSDFHGHGEHKEVTVLLSNYGKQDPHRAQVLWFKTSDARHVLWAQQLSEADSVHNEGTLALLRMWILSAYVPLSAGPGLFSQVVLASQPS